MNIPVYFIYSKLLIEFIRKYYKSLNTLFISLGTDEAFDVQTIEMIEFFELL